MSMSTKRFTPDRLADYSESEIIKEIRRVVREECGGIVPSRDQFERLARVSRVTIAKRFGTYREGIRRAGFAVHKQLPRPQITAEQVRSNLLEVLERAKGYAFTQDFFCQNGGAYCVEVVKARLGFRDWKSVLEAIGAKKEPRIVHTVVSPHAQRRTFLAELTETDLFKELDRVWREKGRRPRYAEFAEASQLGIRVYETRYGSWTQAIEAFCKANHILVQGLARTRPTKAILIDELRSVQLRCPGAILTFDTYKAGGGTYGVSVFRTQFGSWTAAVEAAGGISGERARYSKDELFVEIQRLWEQFGRQPTQLQMSKQGNISPKCFSKMFGSWTKAIHAFCDDRNDHQIPTASAEPTNCDRDLIEPPTSAAASEMRSKNTAPLVVEHATGRTVSLKLRFRVLTRDNFACKACGRSPANHPGLDLQVDHVVPYANGGETEVDNLQTLCRECNLGKSNH